MTVHAPRLIRSPSCRVTLSPIASSRLLTKVPLADPGSLMNQVPSDAEVRTACSRLTPGSTGWSARSISGTRSRAALRRPIRISLPTSRTRRSEVCAGNSTAEPATARAGRTGGGAGRTGGAGGGAARTSGPVGGSGRDLGTGGAAAGSRAGYDSGRAAGGGDAAGGCGGPGGDGGGGDGGGCGRLQAEKGGSGSGTGGNSDAGGPDGAGPDSAGPDDARPDGDISRASAGAAEEAS